MMDVTYKEENNNTVDKEFNDLVMDFFNEAIPSWKKWIQQEQYKNEVFSAQFEEKLFALIKSAHPSELMFLVEMMAKLSRPTMMASQSGAILFKYGTIDDIINAIDMIVKLHD